MKKFIIGTLGVLFASAIAVAVWTSNVKANDLLAMNVEAISANNENVWFEKIGGEYTLGTFGNNWKEYTVTCAKHEMLPSSGTQTSQSSSSDTYADKGNVSTDGSRTSVDYGGTSSNNNNATTASNFELQDQVTSIYEKNVCGNGRTKDCRFSAGRYNGNPCSRRL